MQFTITRAHVEQMIKTLEDCVDAVIANRGSCRYSSPCIIGSIMPKEFVGYLISINKDDELIRSIPSVDYDSDVDAYHVSAAQEYFDNDDIYKLDAVINALKSSIGE